MNGPSLPRPLILPKTRGGLADFGTAAPGKAPKKKPVLPAGYGFPRFSSICFSPGLDRRGARNLTSNRRNGAF
jgi:hypothetical protein